MPTHIAAFPDGVKDEGITSLRVGVRQEVKVKGDVTLWVFPPDTHLVPPLTHRDMYLEIWLISRHTTSSPSYPGV